MPRANVCAVRVTEIDAGGAATAAGILAVLHDERQYFPASENLAAKNVLIELLQVCCWKCRLYQGIFVVKLSNYDKQAICVI